METIQNLKVIEQDLSKNSKLSFRVINETNEFVDNIKYLKIHVVIKSPFNDIIFNDDCVASYSTMFSSNKGFFKLASCQLDIDLKINRDIYSDCEIIIVIKEIIYESN